MAIGLEETDTGVWKLLMAVSIHAVPIVFCVGTDMISSGVKKVKMIVYMIVLSINTPIGILIGILVTIHMENATGQHVLLIGVLQVRKYLNFVICKTFLTYLIIIFYTFFINIFVDCLKYFFIVVPPHY